MQQCPEYRIFQLPTWKRVWRSFYPVRLDILAGYLLKSSPMCFLTFFIFFHIFVNAKAWIFSWKMKGKRWIFPSRSLLLQFLKISNVWSCTSSSRYVCPLLIVLHCAPRPSQNWNMKRFSAVDSGAKKLFCLVLLAKGSYFIFSSTTNPCTLVSTCDDAGRLCIGLLISIDLHIAILMFYFASGCLFFTHICLFSNITLYNINLPELILLARIILLFETSPNQKRWIILRARRGMDMFKEKL